jgi:transcriptional regulator with XRE-family HTH domain
MEAILDYVNTAMRKKRLEKNWSQQELADYVNLSRNFISDIENPKKIAHLNIIHINELAKVFGCSPKDFLPSEPL